jgi:hypothetical protein
VDEPAVWSEINENQTDDINRSDMDFVDLPSGETYVVFNTGNQGEATPPNVPTSFDAAGVVHGTSRQWLESYFSPAKTDDAVDLDSTAGSTLVSMATDTARLNINDQETPLRFEADRAYVGSNDTSWVKWVVVSSMMDRAAFNDSERAQFLETFDSDIVDWDSGLIFNRGQFARSRGIACSSPKEFEYEESLQFDQNFTQIEWADNGMSRDEHNQAVPYGKDRSKFYMELNAPRWKETIKQGELRPSIFGDSVIQDNIGSGINKAGANYDDHSNARFLRWLARRCAQALPGCSAPVRAILSQRSTFNIRDHIATARQGHNQSQHPPQVAMEVCGSTQFGPQGIATLAPDSWSFTKFHDGRCLTSVGAKGGPPGVSSSGNCAAAKCVAGNSNQSWKFDAKSGHLISARTDCAGNSSKGCCLSISSGHRSTGTIVQVFGCEGCPASACTFRRQSSKAPNETLLVSTTSGLCLTSGVQPPPLPVDNAVLIQDPVIHEYMRHGYISALSNWDDLAAAIRRAGQTRELTSSGTVIKKPVPGVWGRQLTRALAASDAAW